MYKVFHMTLYLKLKLRLRLNFLLFFYTIVLFFSTSSIGWTQPPQKLISGANGIWDQHGDLRDLEEWQASWIWTEEKDNVDVLLARRTFELSTLPTEALLRITASSQYQLYLNGRYISRGPARSAPHHQSYDVLDITSHLKEGKNSLAIRVHHQKNKYSYHFLGRAGLLVQLDLKEGAEWSSIPSDIRWRVAPDPSWNSDAPLINRFQMVVNDRVDLRKAFRGWNTLNFDDSEWEAAKPLMRTVGWPLPPKNAAPQTLTPPWTNLIPRDVPYLLEREIHPRQVIGGYPIEKEQLVLPFSGKDEITTNVEQQIFRFLEKGQTLTLMPTPSAKGYFLLFDFGKIGIGHPQLSLTGVAGTRVEILSAPYRIDQQFTANVLDSDFRDRIILSGQLDQWEATYFKPARFLGLYIPNLTSPIELHSIGLRLLEYPFEELGNIQSKDAAWVNHYMEASAATIRVCTTDGYTDNYRERRQYAQTGYYAAMGNNWLFRDYSLQRRYLIQVAQEQEANGIMPAYAPLGKDDFMVILDSNCLWLRSLRDYYLYSGDFLTVFELLPAAEKLLDLLYSFTNDLGMIDNPPYPYWLDHSLIDRRGANFCLNGHYLGALEDFIQILEWMDQDNIYQERSNRLRKSMQEYFWDEEKGLFADAWIQGKRSAQFSEHANAMALALEIATPEQAAQIIPQLLEKDTLNYTQRSSGMTMVTPAMSYFLHKGLCTYGYIPESMELFRRRFDKMLDPSYNGTLWEEWWLDGTGRSGKFIKGKTRSDAQTESAFPPALFAEYLLGVQPIQPAWETVLVKYQNSGLQNLEGIVPTPIGTLEIEWEINERGQRSLWLNIPKVMKVKLDLKSLIGPSNRVRINGQELSNEERTKDYLILVKGNHTILF